MDQIFELPKLKINQVKMILRYCDDYTAKQKRMRNMGMIVFKNIIVDDIFFGTADSKRTRTLFAHVSEVLKARRKITERLHLIEVEFFSENDNMQAIICSKCEETNDNCNAIWKFISWLQSIHPKDENQENVTSKKGLNTVKTKECFVLVQQISKENLVRLKTKECSVVKKKVDVVLNYVPAAPEVPKAPALPKLKKKPIPVTPLQLERAQKLSMIALIREFKGTSPEEFVKFCTDRMVQANDLSSVEILTIEQADNDLWHELRKGRITASRIYEASRCTMLNGSLTNTIIGVSSGFSFAMKRGTNLEGHVFAVLQQDYPDLRNTGLVLDPQFPWMGASPDGICEEFVLEIKCPYTRKTYDCYVDVKKLSKRYYAQIQLQMHMTRKTKALLGVAALDFETTKNVTKVWIDYDKVFVEEIIAESYEFWCKAVFKALLKKCKIK